MDLLNTNLKAGDVWVELYRNGVYPNVDMGNIGDNSDPSNFSNYEVVDKIIYINPTDHNTMQLIPQSFRIEQDYTYGNVEGNDNSTPLGDHNPVVVEFKYFKAGDIIPVEVVRGDANGDGVVNGTDIQDVINFIIADQYDSSADVNEDGKVNGTDIQEVINIIVNAD
jgi:hypothetical protein